MTIKTSLAALLLAPLLLSGCSLPNVIFETKIDGVVRKVEGKGQVLGSVPSQSYAFPGIKLSNDDFARLVLEARAISRCNSGNIPECEFATKSSGVDQMWRLTRLGYPGYPPVPDLSAPPVPFD